ncbi:MAG: T9SS type A sorting domain-containing protein [bacterium]
MILLTLTGKEYLCQSDEYFPLQKGNYWQYVFRSDVGVSYFQYSITQTPETLADGSIIAHVSQVGPFGNYVVAYKIMNNDNSVIYWTYEGLRGKFYPYIKFKTFSTDVWNLDPWTWGSLSESSIGQVMTTVVDSLFKFNFYFDPLCTTVGEYRYFMKGIGLVYRGFPGSYSYSLLGCKINGVSYGTFVDVEDELTPVDYKVSIKNYPNPFNNQTIIKYTIPEAEFVNITMYDMLGRELEVLKNEYQNAGAYTIPWTAKGLSSGVYFAVIKYKNQMLTHKIIYQK